MIIEQHHHVFLVEPVDEPLSEMMAQIRLWLDSHKIVLSGFSYEAAPSGGIEMQLTFANRHHAELCEQAFGGMSALAPQIKKRP